MQTVEEGLKGGGLWADRMLPFMAERAERFGQVCGLSVTRGTCSKHAKHFHGRI